MLKIINLDMSFKDLCIFKNVNVEINQNGLYAIEGRNGIGKTTLLKLISSFIKPTNGQILNDYKYSYVDSTYMIFDNLTVLENLKIICNDEDEIDKFLNDFQIYNIKEKQAILCSKGERVRIAIARAILSGSNCLLLDEPIANLDYMTSITIMDLLKKLSQFYCIIITSNSSLTNKYCDIIYEIKNYNLITHQNYEIINHENIIPTDKNNIDYKILKKTFINKYFYSFFILSFLFLMFLGLSILIYSISYNDLYLNCINMKDGALTTITTEHFENKYDTYQQNKFQNYIEGLDTVYFGVYNDNKMVNSFDILDKIEKNSDYYFYNVANVEFLHVNDYQYPNLAIDEMLVSSYLYNYFKAMKMIDNNGFLHIKDYRLKVLIDEVNYDNEYNSFLSYYKQKVESYVNVYEDDYVLNLNNKFFDDNLNELKKKYMHAYINEATFKNIIFANFINSDIRYEFKDNINLLYGRAPTNSLDIVVSTGFVETIFKTDNISDFISDLQYYLTYENFEFLVNIVGVYDDDNFGMLFNKNFTNNLLQKIQEKENFIVYDIIFHTNMLDEFIDNRYIPLNCGKILNNFDLRDKLEIYFVFIMITLLIIFLCIVILFSLVYTLKHKNNFKILKYLPMLKKAFNNIFFKYSLITGLISLITTIVLDIILFKLSTYILYNSMLALNLYILSIVLIGILILAYFHIIIKLIFKK